MSPLRSVVFVPRNVIPASWVIFGVNKLKKNKIHHFRSLLYKIFTAFQIAVQLIKVREVDPLTHSEIIAPAVPNFRKVDAHPGRIY